MWYRALLMHTRIVCNLVITTEHAVTKVTDQKLHDILRLTHVRVLLDVWCRWRGVHLTSEKQFNDQSSRHQAFVRWVQPCTNVVDSFYFLYNNYI